MQTINVKPNQEEGFAHPDDGFVHRDELAERMGIARSTLRAYITFLCRTAREEFKYEPRTKLLTDFQAKALINLQMAYHAGFTTNQIRQQIARRGI